MWTREVTEMLLEIKGVGEMKVFRLMSNSSLTFPSVGIAFVDY